MAPITEATTEDDLRKYFSNYGSVLGVKIVSNDLRHAYITFDNFDSVDKCVLMKRHVIDNIITTAKKGLTKTAMEEAEKRFRSQKERRRLIENPDEKLSETEKTNSTENRKTTESNERVKRLDFVSY